MSEQDSPQSIASIAEANSLKLSAQLDDRLRDLERFANPPIDAVAQRSGVELLKKLRDDLSQLAQATRDVTMESQHE